VSGTLILTRKKTKTRGDVDDLVRSLWAWLPTELPEATSARAREVLTKCLLKEYSHVYLLFLTAFCIIGSGKSIIFSILTLFCYPSK